MIESKLKTKLQTWTAVSNLTGLVSTVFAVFTFLTRFVRNISAPDEASDGTPNIVVLLSFKDQISANSVKRDFDAKSERKNWSANQACLSV